MCITNEYNKTIFLGIKKDYKNKSIEIKKDVVKNKNYI